MQPFKLIISLLLLLTAPSYVSSNSDYLPSECLKVPTSTFVSSLQTAIGFIRDATPIISQFANTLGDFRLQNAVLDCLDLLDFSVDELDWTASASQNINGKYYSSGDLSSDLRTWLSAALTNQETCMEGFEGTNGIAKGMVEGSLQQISSLVKELLKMVHPVSSLKSKKSSQFPYWFKREDRKLLLVNGTEADAIVAADGTGNYTSIMDAVLAAPDYRMKRYVIYIKRGVYKEYVEIKKKKWNLMMIGDGIDATIISGNRNYIDGWSPFRGATFAVSAVGFIARDITFENTAGPEKHQAVAVRSDSDLSVFFRCAIRGYQDSLYTHAMRQFFRECKISGTVDFIFGHGTVVFQNCEILAKRGLPDQKNAITAHGRIDPDEPSGFSLQFCNITADSDLLPYVNSTRTYLGRPWKIYSRTIFMQNYISNIVRPEGWLEMNGSLGLDTLYYAEYMNYGEGAGVSSRVKWPGYHVLNSSSEAINFTVAQFLLGDLWLPSTGVQYTAGLAA
ncbi:pectinesterase/pectinesterase inhibitor PPE8B-like [Mangifera indica]|uniref:pectinesterase/pectinesterase inhibitor PPE8B-like n=1 Tax=Mangifera indica TaxID=29780 RepID=UPI001CFB9F70|nr:pectinesterase/pectinesterase inhibitor PPE8B-like [Mangifera indica]